jgi:hypothetical protein
MSSSYPSGFIYEHSPNAHSRMVSGTGCNEKHEVDLLA